jgi:glutathione S-transferase
MVPSITFYCVPYSTSSVTEAVLEVLKVPHVKKTMSISNGDCNSADFLRINPNGRVPAIVVDGVAIWESSAITMYLGETFGVGTNLYPEPGTLRGQAMMWLVWSSTTLASNAGRYSAHITKNVDGVTELKSKDFIPVDKRSEIELSNAEKHLHIALGVLNDALAAPNTFIIGTSYSLVDTHIASFMGWIMSLELDLTKYTNILTWMEACKQLNK